MSLQQSATPSISGVPPIPPNVKPIIDGIFDALIAANVGKPIIHGILIVVKGIFDSLPVTA